MAKRFNSKLDAQLLGQRLRAARKKHGYTLKYLAAAVGVHHSQISRIERGRIETVSENLQLICNFLDEPLESSSCAHMQTLGHRVDQLLLVAPQNEMPLRMLVEALEAMQSRAS